jgi:hypothetical protein
LDSSYDVGLYLQFPTFNTKAIVGSDDIYLDMVPSSVEIPTIDTSTIPANSDPSLFCHHTNKLHDNSNIENDQLDNIVRDLRQYYHSMKTKRQLGMNVPAGFPRHSNHQQQFILHTPPRKSANNFTSTSHFSLFSDLTSDHLLDTPIHSNKSSDTVMTSSTTSTNPPTSSYLPIICSVDKPSSSLPKHMTMSEDLL